MTSAPLPWRKLRERGGGLLFALGLNALLLLALLTLAPQIDPMKREDRNPVSFDLAESPKAQEAREEEARKGEEEKPQQQKEEKQPEQEERQEPPDKQPEPVPRPPDPEPRKVEKPVVELPFIKLSREQMAAADIGRLPKAAPAGPPDGASADAGAGAGARQGPGEGPGGVQLFEAEWYRRPTQAELATYLPADAPADGWGLVACKTVENYRVENCQALGESPLGSGLARAVRLAAWQFMVRPPRVNGKPMIGSWVRIRIDYSRRPADAGGAGN